MPDEFYGGATDEALYEDSSDPTTIVQVHESDIWPVDNNCLAGAGGKDQIAGGLHPIVAIGDRATPDRPENLTGVVISFTAGLTTAKGLVRINIADGYIVRNYVANIASYDTNNDAVLETGPIVPGQPVYVDDSSDIVAKGVTVSLSPLNEAGTANPLAGYLWYCEDEYADQAVGGPNVSSTFVTSVSDILAYPIYCILLTNDSGQACCDV